MLGRASDGGARCGRECAKLVELGGVVVVVVVVFEARRRKPADLRDLERPLAHFFDFNPASSTSPLTACPPHVAIPLGSLRSALTSAGMPALLLPRPSPCLFCAFAARSRPPAQRPLPRVQVAYRTAGRGGDKKYMRPSREDLDAQYAENKAKNARTGHVGRVPIHPVVATGQSLTVLELVQSAQIKSKSARRQNSTTSTELHVHCGTREATSPTGGA
jgi:hypothetical protein